MRVDARLRSRELTPRVSRPQLTLLVLYSMFVLTGVTAHAQWVAKISDTATDPNTPDSRRPVQGVIHYGDADFARQHGDVFMLIPILETCAKGNDPRALYELGLIYKYGSKPFTDQAGLITEMKIDADADRAIQYFKSAAQLGHMEATYELASMYLRERGTRRNVRLSMQYYQQAAALGDVRAQNDLGRFLIQGSYIDANIDAGIEWIRQSARAGYTVAELNLAGIYERGEVAPMDYAAALKWALLAARWYPGADERIIDEANKIVGRLRDTVDDNSFQQAADEAERMERELLLSGKINSR